jgi:hypothetical protein
MIQINLTYNSNTKSSRIDNIDKMQNIPHVLVALVYICWLE